MIKSSIDPRTYRVVRLTNNLEAMIISDLNSTKCSASMSLGVGTFQDDDDAYGLAHFFEHMLFLGSKSFPSPSIFDNHLTEYFGSTNAFTEEEKTIFYFDVGYKGFETALHMFSRMFAEPLLDYSLMNKEIEAVNSENDKNLNNDNWRQHQLIRSLSNPRHPFSKFGTGSKSTLGSIEGQVLHQKIRNFYKKYYVPENMKLVVEGNIEMDALQELVTKYFSDIRLDSLQREPEMRYGEINTKENPFYKENLGKVVWYKKLSSSINLDFIFIMDEVNSKYKTKPYNYVSYMLRYSAEKSFVNYLKSLKWATKLDAGIINSFTSFSEFAITISLTEEGLKNVDSIIDMLFGYLGMLRNKGVNSEIYKEIATINENSFRFMEKNSNYGKYMSNLAGNMFDYEYKDIMYGDYCHSIYNETMIMNFMDGLVVENSLIFIGSQNYPNDSIRDKFFKNSNNKTEKWYGTLYMEKKLDDSQIVSYSKVSNDLNNYFILRPTNRFITAENQTLNCTKKDCYSSVDKIIPSLYYETENIKIWHKIDKTYLVPKLNLYLSYLFKNIKDSPVDSTIIHLFYNYIKLSLDTKLSEAVDAGNKVGVTLNNNGIQLKIEAYSDVIEKIFQDANDVILNSYISENIFKEIVEITFDQFKEKENSAPYLKCFMIFNKIVLKNSTHYSQNLKNIKSITYEKFIGAINQYKKTIMFKALFYGNYNIFQIDNMKHYLAKYLPPNTKLGNTTDYETQIRNITNSYIFRTINDLPSEINNVIVNYYQISVRDYKFSLISNIIELFWGNFFYYHLRTLKQLGYIVNSAKVIENNVMYYRIIVQGAKATPDVMNLEIDKTISLLNDKMKNLTQHNVNEYKKSIRMMLFKPEDNLNERSNVYWSEINENSYFFDRKFRLKEELNNIKVEDVKLAFKNIFISNPKKISIQIFSGNKNITSISNNIKEDYFLNRKIKSIVTNQYDEYTKLPLLTLPRSSYENYSVDQTTENEKDSASKKKRKLK